MLIQEPFFHWNFCFRCNRPIADYGFCPHCLKEMTGRKARRRIHCKKCDGSGLNEQRRRCPLCDGRGFS